MAFSNICDLSNAKLCIKRDNAVEYCVQGTLAPYRWISLKFSTTGNEDVKGKKKKEADV